MISRPDDLVWLATTVAMEAEGEPWEGKLAVAWVLVNRMAGRQSASEIGRAHV